MSDQSMGPGWWQASDGKWYPPQPAPTPPPMPTAPPADAFTSPAPVPPSSTTPPPLGGYQTPPPAPGYNVPPPGNYPGTGGFEPKKKSKVPLILGIIALILVVGIGGCVAIVGLAVDKAADEVNDNDARTVLPDGSTDTGGDDGTDGATDDGGGDSGAGGAGSREAPLPIGTEVDLDNGWRVKIVSADLGPGAADAVAAANQFNDPATEGMRYIIVNLSATYTGNGDAATEAPFSGFSLSVFGSANVERNSYDAYAVPPEPALDQMSELAEGGTAMGNIVMLVGADETDLVARIEPMFAFDSTEAWLGLG